MNYEIYLCFKRISYDHRIVTAKIHLCLLINKTQVMKVSQYDLFLFKNRDIRNHFTETVRNEFDTIQQTSGTHTPNDEYESFGISPIEAAVE